MSTSARARVVHHSDPKAHNTWEAKDVIVPADVAVSIADGGVKLTLPALSLTTMQLTL